MVKMGPHLRRARRVRLASWILAILGAVVGVLVVVSFAGGRGLIGTPESWAESTSLDLVFGTTLALSCLALAALGFVAARRVARSTPATFLTDAEERAVLEAIARFEKTTSGEIRVHLERKVEGDVLAAAAEAFEALGMSETEARNGVLFFVATQSRRFAVVGDVGIDDRVDPEHWSRVAKAVETHFANGHFGDGLVEGIELAGRALEEHFPHRLGDVNELPDDISRSD